MGKMLKYGLLLVVVALGACSRRDASPFVDEHRAVAEETYNAADMNETLEKILQWHQSNQTGLALALNPGKDREMNLKRCHVSQPKNCCNFGHGITAPGM